MRLRTSQPRVLIVGAGLAGLRVSEGLASGGFRGIVTLVGDEQHEPYNRPALSKDALVHASALSSLTFRRRYDEHTNLRLGEVVQSIDLDAHTAVLASGETLEFQILVAASGVTPRRSFTHDSITEKPLKRMLGFKTVIDLEALRSMLQPGGRVLIVGSGFIGCELASSLADLGQHVTLLSRNEMPMVKAVGRKISARLRGLMEDKGIDFHAGAEIASVTELADTTHATLSCGDVLSADVILDAVGSSPNLSYLDGNDLDLSSGLYTDDHMKVRGRENFFAVGDIANPAFGHLIGAPRRFEHWMNAVDTASLAVDAILRPEEKPTRLFTPAAWSDQFGQRIQSYGVRTPEASEVDLLRSCPRDAANRDWVLTGFVVNGVLTGVCGMAPAGKRNPAMAWRSRLFSSMLLQESKP